MTQIPTTINQSFNIAIKHLLKFHPVFELATYPTLDIGKRPKGLRSDKQWQYYISQLTDALVIGRRNKWLRVHVNRRGCPVYWLIDIPSHCIKKDSAGNPAAPIYSDKEAR